VERREASSRLRGTAHASQTWCRVVTDATENKDIASRRSAIPSVGDEEAEKEGKEKEPGAETPGTEEDCAV
jgi:hypothetical protein